MFYSNEFNKNYELIGNEIQDIWNLYKAELEEIVLLIKQKEQIDNEIDSNKL